MTEPLYKIVYPDGSPCHGGSGKWSLPNGKPGKWMPKLDKLVACQRGYHLCRAQDLPAWVRTGTHLYRAEAKGRRLVADDKVVVAQARLVERVPSWTNKLLRAWASECALRAVCVTLPPALRAIKTDEALVVACERAGTLSAASNAAVAASNAAVAASDAARAAWAASYAAGAASYAAWAASDAAWAASGAALAASNAAVAASYAAGAASDAAGAASDAALAASDAAWAAERRWQSERLAALLGIEV